MKEKVLNATMPCTWCGNPVAVSLTCGFPPNKAFCSDHCQEESNDLDEHGWPRPIPETFEDALLSETGYTFLDWYGE